MTKFEIVRSLFVSDVKTSREMVRSGCFYPRSTEIDASYMDLKQNHVSLFKIVLRYLYFNCKRNLGSDWCGYLALFNIKIGSYPYFLYKNCLLLYILTPRKVWTICFESLYIYTYACVCVYNKKITNFITSFVLCLLIKILVLMLYSVAKQMHHKIGFKIRITFV